MSHRQHLFSLQVGYALREALHEGYHRNEFARDLVAGITVGVIAIPLAMALAIASGVAPQYGLYTAIIAGVVIALTGGSRYSISGPTAAFVIILHPLAMSYGLGGLVLATFMSGIILLAMSYARLGRFIEYIPEPVTLGFTGGIAIVIAVQQIPDFVGLTVDEMPELFVGKLLVIGAHLSELDPASTLVAAFTLLMMIVWPKLRTPIPAHLPALIFASLMGVLLLGMGIHIETIGSRFHYLLADGTQANGIPPYLPTFEWPWQRPGADGQPLGLSLSLIFELLPSAFAIAMLGAIESLLCAVVLDGFSGKRHSANSELFGQGLGNLIVPFFGGVTATAAIARSATNFKAGAVSPIAGIIHALVVLMGLLFLTRILAYVPMPAMAGILMMTAWNMSDAPHTLSLIRKSQRGDVVVLLVCLSLTVFFDMVTAITTGVLLASVLFMKESAALTRLVDITNNQSFTDKTLPERVKIFKIRGALFFAAGDRVISELSQQLQDLDGLILHMQYSSYLDAGGLAAIEKLQSYCERQNITLRFSAWQFQPLKTLAKARNESTGPLDISFATLDEAIDNVIELTSN